MKKLLLASVVLVLTGCATKIVYVPVETCPEPKEIITTPSKPQLSSDATTKQKLEALRLYVGDLEFELSRCIVVLDGYRGKAK